MENVEFDTNNNLLKKGKEDNLAEVEEIADENFYHNNNKDKYKIKYSKLFDYIKDRSDIKFHKKNEFLCNILLMPSKIDFFDKLSILSLLTYFYKEDKKINQIYNIAKKFEENVNYLKNINPMLFVKVFYRAAFFLNKKEKYIYAMKYINKSINIMNNYIKSLEDKNDYDLVDNYFKEISINLNKYIRNSKIKIYNNDGFLSIKKIKEYIQKCNSIIKGKNDLNVKDDDFLFIINKIWLIKLKNFLEDIIIARETNIIDLFLNKAFDFEYFFDSYFNNEVLENKTEEKEVKSKNIKFLAYPGPINNYYITDFKDNWNNFENEDENSFIKKDMKLNIDYCLINEKDWDIFNTYFGSTNTLLRRKNNVDLIKLKFILFDKRINKQNKNINLLKIKYIQVNRNINIKQLKEKIINIANDNLEKEENVEISLENNIPNLEKGNIINKKINFFTLNKEKKDILIEICFSFIINNKKYESIYIHQLDINDEEKISDFIQKINKNKEILLIEIIDIAKNEEVFLEDLNIRMKNELKCTICNKILIDIFNCKLCNFSLFCSNNCAIKSIEHVNLDKKLKKIKESEFNISDLLAFDLKSILKEKDNWGRIGLSNRKNFSHFISCLQCLSNTEDLTKYFLNGDFSKEIKNFYFSGSKCEISKAYYDLINQMWKGSDKTVQANDFIYTFLTKEKTYIDNQKDPNIFLLSLFKYMHNDLNRIKTKITIKIEEKQSEESDKQTSNRFWNSNKNREDSIITDLFKGQYKCTTKCLICGSKSITFDEYINLSLPIPTKTVKIKLFLFNGNCLYLNIAINEYTKIKEIIKKAIDYLDTKKYYEYSIKTKIQNIIYNFSNKKLSKSILYNNIIVTEFSDDIKMINIYQTSYNNIKNKIIKNTENKNKKNIMKIHNDNSKLMQIYDNNKNIEIVLFERDIYCIDKNIINIFVYPIQEIEDNEKIYRLSYPIVLGFTKDNTLKELKLAILMRFTNIILENDKSDISICFPHFSEKWKNLAFPKNICPLCGEKYKKNNKYCLLSKKFNENSKISEIIKIIGNNRNLVLYGKSMAYDLKSELYKNIKLFSFDRIIEKEQKQNLDINDCLDLFNNEKILIKENNWFCKICKKNQKCIKNLKIYKTPIYLIIHLNRFNQKGDLNNHLYTNKNESLINYKTILDLNEFIIGPKKDKSNYYLLYGIVLHKKSLKGIHCLSYCKNQEEWLIYDNEHVKHCENPIDKDAYLLFYKRINND